MENKKFTLGELARQIVEKYVSLIVFIGVITGLTVVYVDYPPVGALIMGAVIGLALLVSDYTITRRGIVPAVLDTAAIGLGSALLAYIVATLLSGLGGGEQSSQGFGPQETKLLLTLVGGIVSVLFCLSCVLIAHVVKYLQARKKTEK